MVFCTAPADQGNTTWESLSLCRVAVGVLCSPIPLGQYWLRESYSFEEKQLVYCTVPADYTNTRCWSLTPLQRSSQYFVQLQPTEVLPHCREAVGVLWANTRWVCFLFLQNNPSRLCQHLFGESYLSVEKQSVFCTAKPTGQHSLGKSFPHHLQRSNRCILQPQPIGSTLIKEVLPLHSEVVGILYSPSRLGHHSLGES